MSIFSQRSHFSGLYKKVPFSARRIRRGGFTLIELLVVIGIMLVLTTMLLFRHQQFNSATLLRTLAYSVALSVRQAQVYGTSVRESSASTLTTPVFAGSYGLFFTRTTPGQYLLFADSDNNGQYDVGEAVVETLTVPRGYSITGACGVLANGIKRCTAGSLDSSGISTVDRVHILFRRPNPEAVFTAYNGATPVAGPYTSAYIQVQTNDGSTRSVTVNATGQIQVGGLGT